MTVTKQKLATGRKPVTKVTEAMGRAFPQEVIWQLVRELREFSVADLEAAAVNYFGGRGNGFNNGTVKSYLLRLTRGGYLEKAELRVNGNQKDCTWTLVRDTGAEAPRLTLEGKPSKSGLVRDQMWCTLKIIGEFNYIELASVASTEEVPVAAGTARAYIRLLYNTGYLVLVRKSKPGTAARYRRVPKRCEGGKAPMVLRTKEVFDRNLMQVMKPVR